MSASFTARDGKDPVQSLIDLFSAVAKPTAEQMTSAGDHQKARIQARTAQGVDVNGQTFAPYSPQYAKARAKKGLRVSPPDLRASGELLDSMETQVLSDHSFAIVVRDPGANSYGPALNYGNSRMPARHFFATSSDELKMMLVELRGGGSNE